MTGPLGWVIASPIYLPASAPAPVAAKQLRELGLRLREQPGDKPKTDKSGQPGQEEAKAE